MLITKIDILRVAHIFEGGWEYEICFIYVLKGWSAFCFPIPIPFTDSLTAEATEQKKILKIQEKIHQICNLL